MSAPIPRIEALTTKEFTATYSTAPTTPSLFFYAGSGSTTAVMCGTVAASSTTAFYSHVTFGNSAGLLLSYEWVASVSAGPLYHRGVVHLIRTGT